jgi:PEP-CTERM motif
MDSGARCLPPRAGSSSNNGQGNVFAGELGITTDPNAPAFFGIFNPAFKNYDLSTTFGPVTDMGTFGFGGSTVNGSLSLPSFGLVTFAVTAVPEPMTLLLAGIALAAFGLGYRKKRLAQHAISADRV